MQTRGNFELPSYGKCTQKFLVQVLNLEKKSLKQQEVSSRHVPAYEELAIQYVWGEAMKHHDFPNYMPDHWKPINNKVDRKFFYKILNTICPHYVNNLVEDCQKQRKEARNKPKVESSLRKIPSHMLKMLLKHDYVPSKYTVAAALIRIFPLYSWSKTRPVWPDREEAEGTEVEAGAEAEDEAQGPHEGHPRQVL